MNGGDINWQSPKIQPWTRTECGVLFRTAFSCFQDSEAQIKGIDCADKLNAYLTCCDEHPNACDATLTADE